MLATPQIIQTTAQTAAIIHLTVPRNEMMKVFGPAVGELMAALAAQGVEPVGAVFAHHMKMSPDIFDFELGVKLSAPVIRWICCARGLSFSPDFSSFCFLSRSAIICW